MNSLTKNLLVLMVTVIVLLGASNRAEAQLTSHFQNWLNANGYGGYNFNSGGNSYGGRASSSDAVVNQPVIFIHGNSDAALGTGIGFTGWNDSINYFRSQGYKTAELYATTWGDANPALSAYQYHSKPNLQKVRAFIQAVKAYTGASKVDVVAHSMGVTLGRKAILGGAANDGANGGSYNLGASLTPLSASQAQTGVWFRVIKRAARHRPARQPTDFIRVMQQARRRGVCRISCITSIIQIQLTRVLTFTRFGQPLTRLSATATSFTDATLRGFRDKTVKKSFQQCLTVILTQKT
jgi:hypothetical protein